MSGLIEEISRSVKWSDENACDALSLLVMESRIGGLGKIPCAIFSDWVASFFQVRKPLRDGLWVLGGRKGRMGDSSCFLEHVEFFDGKSWRNGPSLSCPRVGAAAVSFGSQGVLISGGFSKGNDAPVRSVERLGLGSKIWKFVPSMRAARYGHCMLFNAGWVYAFGGEFETSSGAERWDGQSCCWQIFPDPPFRVSAGRAINFQVNLIEGLKREVFLYLGGCEIEGSGRSGKANDKIAAFCPSALTWKLLPLRMRPGRTAFAVHPTEDGGILISGGFSLINQKESEIASVQFFSEKSLKIAISDAFGWERELIAEDFEPGNFYSSLPSPRAGCHGLTTSSGCRLVLGGECVDGLTWKLFDSVLQEKNGWSNYLPPMMVARTAFAACVSPAWPRYFVKKIPCASEDTAEPNIRESI